MNQTELEISPAEIAEIERHKYFLSEKAGHDIGWEAAEQDWELHHAEQFRQSPVSKSASPVSKSAEPFRQSPVSKSKAARVGALGKVLKRVLTKNRAR
jgi:hypothetical protein